MQSVLFASAPRASSSLTARPEPFRAAPCKGVKPCRVRQSTSAFASTSAPHTSAWFVFAAQCSAVKPATSFDNDAEQRLLSAARMRRTLVWSPDRTASMNLRTALHLPSTCPIVVVTEARSPKVSTRACPCSRLSSLQQGGCAWHSCCADARRSSAAQMPYFDLFEMSFQRRRTPTSRRFGRGSTCRRLRRSDQPGASRGESRK